MSLDNKVSKSQIMASEWQPDKFREHFENSINKNSILFHLEDRKLDYFLSNLELSDNDIALDIGCGYGRLAKILCKSVNKIYGIDINKNNIEYAIQYVGSEKFTGQVVDLLKEKLPFESQSVDKVVCDNVFVFFNKEQQETIFKEILRILKPHGIIAFNFENSMIPLGLFRYFAEQIHRIINKFQNREYSKKYRFNPFYYIRLLKDLGFEVEMMGDTVYTYIGFRGYELFPAMIHPVIIALDKKLHKSFYKYFMSSCSVIAKRRK